MKIKTHLLLISFLLLAFHFSFSQTILVPYRVGEKFGFSDINGKLLTQPKYSHISLGKHYPIGFFTFRRDGKSGVIANKKEIIIENKDYKFEINFGKFIIGNYSKSHRISSDDNELSQYFTFYNLTGKKYPDKFKELYLLDTLGISTKSKTKSKYSILSCLNLDNTNSVFVFDNDKQEITKWLVKNHYEFSYEGFQSLPSHNLTFSSIKAPTSKKERFVFSLTNNEIGLRKIKNEKTSLVKTEKTIMGDTEDSDFVNIRNTYNEASNKKSQNTATKEINSYFSKEKGKIFYKEKDEKYKTLINKEIPINTNVNYSRIELLSYNVQLKDTLINYVTTVHYKLNNKQGLLISKNLEIEPIYDEIKAIKVISKKTEPTSFLVGIKDTLTNKMKYGTIDLYGKAIIPIIYQKITISNSTGNFAEKDDFILYNVDNSNFLVTKNNKQGIISPLNKIILEPIYDEIGFLYHRDLFGNKLAMLKKDSKYGLFSLSQGLIIQPIFERKIGFYIKDYQGKKDFLLLCLKEKDDETFCFARPDGFLYYREK